MWRRSKKDLRALVNRNPALSPKPGGTEGDIRLKPLAKCKHGQFQLADPTVCPSTFPPAGNPGTVRFHFPREIKF